MRKNNYTINRTLLLFVFFVSLQAGAQQQAFRAVVKDSSTQQLLEGVTVSVQGINRAAVTDARGAITLRGLPAGKLVIEFSYVGYRSQQREVTLPDTSIAMIMLAPDAVALNNVIVVSSTRGNDRVENATTKVEVLGPEEMNEESTLKPGNIASILGDVSGVQVQQSSAISGNSNVRIQGLDGRYTQILRDGMPLYDGYSGSFGILTIPPLDLRQVELIKGSSSTLYGGGAIAGLVNLVSRKPSLAPDASFLINQTTLKETNVNAYYAQRGKKAGFTFFAGQTWQQEADVDKDGFSDVPRINSTLIHPVVFFYPSQQSSISVGWSGSFENRLGGDMIAIDGKQDASHPYFEKNKLNRNIFTFIADNRFSNGLTGTIKGSLSLFNRDELTNTYRFMADQQNYYTEASLVKHAGHHTIIAGINVTGDSFRPDVTTPAPVGHLSNAIAGLFIQDTWQIQGGTKLEMGLRGDHHNEYGNFLLPRVALFHRFNDAWATRLGFGMGYSTPDPLAPQIKDYSIYEIRPLDPATGAEKSYGANAEVNYLHKWDGGSFFINNAFFLTKITDPIVGMEDVNGDIAFTNQTKPVVTMGIDTYVQLQVNAWECYLGYTYTDAERKYLPVHSFMPITPRNRAATTLVYEKEGNWRAGIEASYNGSQYREDYTHTPDYVFVALMVEKKFGPKWSLVLNCENLLDERQSKYESLYTGTIADPSFKPLWAPIDGRVVNLCLRFQPFAKTP